jgi:hypothetical protein
MSSLISSMAKTCAKIVDCVVEYELTTWPKVIKRPLRTAYQTAHIGNPLKCIIESLQ